MDKLTKTKPVPPESAADAERRRIGKVVHDDRGNASVKWVDAPTDYVRPVLEVAGDAGAKPRPEESFNPYAHRRPRPRNGGTSARSDLRKLSEWIKLMRELEQRKRNGGDQD